MTSNDDLGLIAQIAIRLLSIPCSEAAVERMFSHLKYLYGANNSDSWSFIHKLVNEYRNFINLCWNDQEIIYKIPF